MRTKSTAASTIIVVVGLAVGLGVGIAGAVTTPGPAAPGGPAVTHWAANARGQTYGSDQAAQSPADEPDLIQAIATNGKTGYVLRSDLEGTEPKTPAQAVAAQTARGTAARTIPVYLSDGVTQIGVFVIQSGVANSEPSSVPTP